MKPRTVHFIAFVAIAVTYCMSTACVVAGDQMDAAVAVKDLLAQCHKAKAEFRPLTPADVDQARTEAVEAIDRLNQRLALAGKNGEDWQKFVELSALQDQLRRSGGPDNAVLNRILTHYNSGHDGLELVWFLDVQKTAHDYAAIVSAVNNPQVRKLFEEKMDNLAESLAAYTAKPTTKDAAAISELVRWLQDARQVPALVQAIQNRFVHPNLLGQISPEVLGAGIVEAVDDVTPIRDCILGTDIYGTAHTIGQTSVELPPNPNYGVVDAIFFGTTTSENVGYHGPVTIYSNATTSLAARKRLWMDATGLSSCAGASNAVTAVQICDIQSNKGRRLIEKMAWKRAGKQQGQAESIASRHAEARLNERIDNQADESIARANKDYVDKFYRPFTERKLFPQMLRFSTTERAISLVGLLAGGGKLAAPGTPPPVATGAEMSVRVHESMINNLAFDALAGRTVYEEKVQAAAVDSLGRLPEKMRGDEDGRPWAITFAPRQPISVTFADDSLKVTLRGVRFCKGDEVHQVSMNISATYKIEKSVGGFKAVRQGSIEVFPPDFVAGMQIDARRQVIRKLLEKRFAKIFEPEILGEGFELPGKWKAAGKMLPIEVVCRDGWLVIGWKRATAETKVAAAE